MKKFSACFARRCLLPSAAFAQSTGTGRQEQQRSSSPASSRPGVDGIVAPPGVKTRGVLTQEFIAKQRPGQSIDDTINLLPGVSFQNNDPYGSSGGTLTIRGFDASRISQTFDGIPLNDTGNYAIYSNQQLDPELIEQVNVNLGTTDVDSPTASATGVDGQLSHARSRPTTSGVRLLGSLGDFNYPAHLRHGQHRRVHPVGHAGLVLGQLRRPTTNPFNSYGKIDKQQYNAKIYQPIGNNGDFISIAGHYNENRNNFFGSVPLRTRHSRRAPTNSGSARRRLRLDQPLPARHATSASTTLSAVHRPTRRQAGVADVAEQLRHRFDEQLQPVEHRQHPRSSRASRWPSN